MKTYHYKITLLMYSGKREVHYLRAANQRDAFDKAHMFTNPFNPYDGTHFIIVERLTKQYCTDHHIEMEAV